MFNLDTCVQYYLMASYLYYVKEESLLTDEEYDYLCKFILDNWSEIKHRHKKLIKKDSLTAGTGYYLKDKQYPVIIKSAAWVCLEERNGN